MPHDGAASPRRSPIATPSTRPNTRHSGKVIDDEQSNDHRAREYRNDAAARNAKRNAACPHVVSSQLPRGERAREVDEQRRDVRDDRERPERARDGQRARDRRLHARSTMCGVRYRGCTACDRGRQVAIATEREQRARNRERHPAQIAERRDDDGAQQENASPRPEALRRPRRQVASWTFASAAPSTPCATS